MLTFRQKKGVVGIYYRKISGRRRKRMIGIRFLVLGLLIFLLLFLVDRAVRPIIQSNAAIQIKALTTTALNEAVIQTLEKTENSYDSLILLEKDGDGRVTSVQTDAASIGKIQSTLTKAVMTCLSGLESSDIQVHLGTLLQPEYFSGRGPGLHFLLRPNGYVTTKIVSSFSEAGINQTQHKILFRISAPMAGAITGYSTQATVEIDFVLADTIIVGSIPEYYTNVVTEDQNLVGDLNDYTPNFPDGE